MTFREQLLITVVDKAVIGMIVALAAYLLNRALERFKSERTLANEFAKQRLARIAELWEALYQWEAEVRLKGLGVQKQIYLIRDDAIPQAIPQAMEPLMPTLLNLRGVRAEEVRDFIERSHFWLGTELHAHLQQRHATILNYLVLLDGQPRDVNHSQFVKDLDATRQVIFDHVKAGAPEGHKKVSEFTVSWWRAVVVWLALMAAESLHGFLRVLFLEPIVGEFRARLITVFTGALLILVLTYLCVPWLRARSTRSLLVIGSLWVLLTVVFEYVSWERITAEYSLERIFLILIGLFILALAPLQRFPVGCATYIHNG